LSIARLLMVVAMMATAWSAQPARSETRALLMGISKYASPIIPDLAGPANDLAAMAEIAREAGATDVVTLNDAQVSRSAAEAALQAMGARSRPGDWILLYYSGHGAQAIAHVPTGRDGRFDQFLPLAGFDPEHQDPERFIVDKDIYVWLKRYVPPDVRILMLVDSCHSGTMHRAVDPRIFGFTARVALRGEERAFELVARPGPQMPALIETTTEATAEREDLANLVYIGASRDDQLALEVPLPGEGAPSRGVLTFAFESALRMAGSAGGGPLADLDDDGRISVLEISSYLNSQVRLLTGQRQESTAFFPTGWSDLPILSALPTPRPRPAARPATVALRQGANSPILDYDVDWRPVASSEEADFVWDLDRKEVLRRSGDLVASDIGDTSALSGVFGKWRLVDALTPLVSELNTRLLIQPAGSDIVYREHAKLAVSMVSSERVSRAGRLYATVFNIASDGVVQLLYPLALDGVGLIPANTDKLLLESEVVAPFGTDHIVALTTPAPPEDLRAVLRTMNGTRILDSVATLVTGHLKQAKGVGSLSIAEIYTSR
jgi:hypothetical protein